MLTAEDGTVEVGAPCVVMGNALLRDRAGHPAKLGDDVLVGPHVHLNGATVDDDCFLGTGRGSVPGPRLADGVEADYVPFERLIAAQQA